MSTFTALMYLLFISNSQYTEILFDNLHQNTGNWSFTNFPGGVTFAESSDRCPYNDICTKIIADSNYGDNYIWKNLTNIDLYSKIRLHIDIEIVSLSSLHGDQCEVKYMYGGTGNNETEYMPLITLNTNGDYFNVHENLTSPSDPILWLRLETHGNSGADKCYFENLYLYGILQTSAPTTITPTTATPTTIFPTSNPTISPTITTQSPTFEPLICPIGSVQIGVFNSDISGCGLLPCSQKTNYQTIQDCYLACKAYTNCISFNFSPIGGHINHLNSTVCTLYDTDIPNQTWGPWKILCGIQHTNQPSYIPSNQPSYTPSNQPSFTPSDFDHDSEGEGQQSESTLNPYKNGNTGVNLVSDNNIELVIWILIVIIVVVIVISVIIIGLICYRKKYKKKMIDDKCKMIEIHGQNVDNVIDQVSSVSAVNSDNDVVTDTIGVDVLTNIQNSGEIDDELYEGGVNENGITPQTPGDIQTPKNGEIDNGEMNQHDDNLLYDKKNKTKDVNDDNVEDSNGVYTSTRGNETKQ